MYGLLKNKIMSDRDWLIKEYLPKLEGRILYIGINDYTVLYPSFIKSGSIYESLDSSVEKSKSGYSSDVHHTIDLQDHFPNYLYDHVSMHGCHGFVGYNINNFNIKEDVHKLHQLLKVGGTLQWGPGCDYIPEYNLQFWESFTDVDPFTKYKTLDSGLKEMNYVWWGMKNEE